MQPKIELEFLRGVLVAESNKIGQALMVGSQVKDVKKSSKKILATSGTTRRPGERLPIEVPISVRALGSRAAFREETTTVDLSRSGAAFRGQKSYRPGMKVRLKFLDAQDLLGDMKEIAAQVVRVSNSPSGGDPTVGVRFKDARLANLILVELLRAKTRTFWALLDIIQTLSPGRRMEEAVQAICRTVEKAMGSERALLFLRDPERRTLRARIEVAGRLEDYEINLGQGLVGRAAELGPVTRVDTLAQDPRFRPGVESYFDERTHSVLCVPLSQENGLSPGLLVVVNKRYGSFTREDEQLGAAVANQISVVLREARLFEDIRNAQNYNEGILLSIAAGVFTFDKSGNLVTVNRSGTELLGPEMPASAGTHYSRIFDRSANSRLCSVVEDVLGRQRRRAAYEVRFRRSDGASLSLSLSAFPLKDVKGNNLGAVLVTEDLTQEQRLMHTLSRYVAREVAEQVLQDESALKLGGTRAEATILYADIRNFTSISEQLDPEEVVKLLNAYYPRIINVVFRHHGMVDKFIGDAILAVFGVPTRRDDDALRAVRAALDIQKEIRAVNAERARKQQLAIEIGIGITSGAVISGNIGSERRMDYTVIGDPVNLAARLEDLTKELDHKVLVSESVWAAVEKEIPCEALGLFKVKGKHEGVAVFAVKMLD